jgi:hypothetical protein
MTERVPIIAAAGVLAAIALGGGFMLLGRGQSSPGATSTQPALVQHLTRTAQEAKRVVKPKKHKTPAVINGMPAALALALRAHPVVVVSLYAPDASVDALAKEEGRQGAALAGAGFVALDVSNEKVASTLTSLLTTGATAADRVLDDPAVLVFRRPNALFVRLNGWTDRELVAQAASNAASAS